MSNTSLGLIGGLGAAAKIWAQYKTEQARDARLDALLAGRGASAAPAAAPADPSLWDQGAQKVKEFFTPTESASAAGGSGDVGLWERLKAGNIDAPGSEAHQRWGAGKTAIDELDADSRAEAQARFDAQEASPPEMPVEAAGQQNLQEAENARLEGANSPDRTDTPAANPLAEEHAAYSDAASALYPAPAYDSFPGGFA